jgi:hypothetical protein
VFWRMPSDAGAALSQRASDPAVGPTAATTTATIAANDEKLG